MARQRRLVIPLASGRAITAGDILIAAAVAALALSLAMPTLRDRSFREDLGDAEQAIEALRAGVERRMVGEGSWPASAEPGTRPPELSGGYLGDVALSGTGWTIEWTRWEVVDSIPVPPVPGEPGAGGTPPMDAGPVLRAAVRTIGAISVHAGDDRLLGELLERHGRDRSFVRDTIWTLILPQRAGGPG